MDYREEQAALERHVQRELAAFERRMAQYFAQGSSAAITGRTQNPRLMRTIADPEADPTYPAEGSGANVFPAVFLAGGFNPTAGVQTGNSLSIGRRRRRRFFAPLFEPPTANFTPTAVSRGLISRPGCSGSPDG